MTMLKGLVFVFVLFFTAHTKALTAVEEGVKAYNDGDFETAERLLTPYKDQPVFDKILRIIAAQKKLSVNSKQLADVKKMRKGKTSLFDKYGHIAHATGKTPSGLSAAISFNVLTDKAKAGNADAAFLTGVFFQDGHGVNVNLRKAVAYFSQAAEKNHAEAMNSLGFYTRYGIAVKKDEAKAAELFERAFFEKNARAAYNLALLHFDGINNKKDFMKAYLYADYAVRKNDGKKNLRKEAADSHALRNKAKGKLTKLQQAYLKKYVPYEMRRLFPEEYVKQRTSSKFLPDLPATGKIVRETDFMKPIKNEGFFKDPLRKDPEDVKDKDLEPLLPDVMDYDESAPATTVFEKNDITPPAPFPEDADVLRAVYFRPALPRAFRLTLDKETSGIPLMVGDTLNLTVYTKVFEDERSKKGGQKNLDNSEYAFSYDKNGVLNLSPFSLIPLSEETQNSEAFLSVTVKAVRAGKSVLRFVPLDDEGFKYAFTVVVHPKPVVKKK